MKRLATAQSIVLVVGLLASAARAAPPHDSALVESALAAEVRTDDRAAISRALENSGARLADQLRAKPTELVGGVIVFAAGKAPNEVATFAASHQLEVTRAEAKVWVESSGVTQTMSFGAQTLLFLDGPLEERLDKLVGRQRGMFMAAARAPGATDPAGLREAAYSHDIRFYKIEAVAPASSFDRIRRGSDAAGVFIDATRARVDDLAIQRANVARVRAANVPVIKGRPLAAGPPPGVLVDPAARSPILGSAPVAPPDPPAQQPRSSQR
jgi:hypothetical protein